jgi:hypothetical protein
MVLQANDEPPHTLRDSIRNCNDVMKELRYDDASIIFIISRVGTSEGARQFVKGLGDDPIIGRMVYVCPNDLGSKRAAFERIGDNNKYSLEVSVIVAHVASYLSYDITYMYVRIFANHSLADRPFPHRAAGSY